MVDLRKGWGRGASGNQDSKSRHTWAEVKGRSRSQNPSGYGALIYVYTNLLVGRCPVSVSTWKII